MNSHVRRLIRFNRMTRCLSKDRSEGQMYLKVLIECHESILTHFIRTNRHLRKDRDEGQKEYTA